MTSSPVITVVRAVLSCTLVWKSAMIAVSPVT